jgi:hypothetical protein
MPLSVRQGVDPVGHHLEQLLQELAGGGSRGLFIKAGHSKLGCAVNGHEQIELASPVRTSAMSMWKKPIG